MEYVIKSVVLTPIVTGVICFFTALFFGSLVRSYFNFPIIRPLFLWVPFGIIVSSFLARISDISLKNGAIAGAIGGGLGGLMVEFLPMIIPSGYKTTADIVSAMTFGGVLAIVLATIVSTLEDCYLKVVSGNYGSDKPFYISKWLNRDDLKYVLIGFSGKESQVPLSFDMSGKISNTHIKMSKVGQNYSIENVSDGQQLFVNGLNMVPGNSINLKNGDSIRLGETTLRFEQKGSKK